MGTGKSTKGEGEEGDEKPVCNSADEGAEEGCVVEVAELRGGWEGEARGRGGDPDCEEREHECSWKCC